MGLLQCGKRAEWNSAGGKVGEQEPAGPEEDHYKGYPGAEFQSPDFLPPPSAKR